MILFITFTCLCHCVALKAKPVRHVSNVNMSVFVMEQWL